MGENEIVDLFWTFYRTTAVYLNIHLRRSINGGYTWGELWDTGVPGQPAPPVRLPDGRLAMIYVDRTHEPKIACRTSSDNGKSWPASTETVIYAGGSESQTWEKTGMNDAWAEMGAFPVGLPDTTPLPNGDVLVVHYAGQHIDATDVHWVRMRT